MKVSTVSLINGLEVPIKAWRIKTGCYGSISSVTFTTSRKMLTTKNLTISELISAQGAPIPIDVYVTLGNNQPVHLFGGCIDGLSVEYDSDLVIITGRDWASELVDARRVLNLKEYTNKTPSQIAEAIATNYGLTPLVVPTPNGMLAGSFFKNDAVLSRQSRPAWTTLVWLAQQIGFQVYVTPARELVFSPIKENAPPANLIWKPLPNNPPGVVVKGLNFRHSIKRNRTFRVRVISYHPKTTQTTTNYVVILGESVPVPTAVSKSSAPRKSHIAAGYYRGAAGQNCSELLTSAGLGIPTYTFNYSGLTPDQCKMKAEAIAEDIAHKLFVVTCLVTGNTDIYPLQPVKLFGEIDPELIGATFFINGLEHAYEQPLEGGTAQSAGFITHITMNTLPPNATEDPTQVLLS